MKKSELQKLVKEAIKEVKQVEIKPVNYFNINKRPEPKVEETSGATNHIFFLSESKIWTSKFWAIKNAIPDPIAILIEIISLKFVETKRVNKIPIIKPI